MLSTRRILLAALLTACILFGPACGDLPSEPIVPVSQQVVLPSGETVEIESLKAHDPTRELEGPSTGELDPQLGVTRVY